MTNNDETLKAEIVQSDGASITPYGSRDEVRELVQRLKIMAPGGMNLTDNEALALAQYSISMSLNPLVGECWFIKDKNGKALGMMPGVAGYRRKAQEQSKDKGADYWLEFDEITNPDERARLVIPEGALAMKCRLYETHKTKAYADSVEKLSKSGAPWSDIKGVLGTKPYVEGISFIKPEEMKQLERGRLQMPHVQRARKRAETHALKQAFHLPFGFDTPSGDAPMLIDEYIVPGSFAELPATEEEIVDGADQATEQLFEEETATEPEEWPDEWVEWVASPTVGVVPPDTHPNHVKALMNLWPFRLLNGDMTYSREKVTKNHVKFWLKEYRAARDSGADVNEAVEGSTAAYEAKYGS